eukprot:Unigene8484_Nuclearia_a/m.25974 Unigene8484_Nuclearia_a/g.25974  ORF Unigene8484_Nuclearia_a/g.25974 Unigene8484_Nuclearia_a/m.25974 type:complete len:368 (+) Unigene8484_Nuclearia_a:39-1142(+)
MFTMRASPCVWRSRSACSAAALSGAACHAHTHASTRWMAACTGCMRVLRKLACTIALSRASCTRSSSSKSRAARSSAISWPASTAAATWLSTLVSTCVASHTKHVVAADVGARPRCVRRCCSRMRASLSCSTNVKTRAYFRLRCDVMSRLAGQGTVTCAVTAPTMSMNGRGRSPCPRAAASVSIRLVANDTCTPGHLAAKGATVSVKRADSSAGVHSCELRAMRSSRSCSALSSRPSLSSNTDQHARRCTSTPPSPHSTVMSERCTSSARRATALSRLNCAAWLKKTLPDAATLPSAGSANGGGSDAWSRRSRLSSLPHRKIRAASGASSSGGPRSPSVCSSYVSSQYVSLCPFAAAAFAEMKYSPW